MATTYTHPVFRDVSVKQQGDVGNVCRSVEIDWPTLTGSATYQTVINDIVKLFQIPAFVKIKRAVIDNNVDLDNGANTLDLDLQLTDGTTTKTALNGGTAAGQAGIVDSDASSQYAAGVDGINYVTPNGNFWLQLKAIAAGTNPMVASAKTTVTLEYTRLLEASEGIRDWPTPTP